MDELNSILLGGDAVSYTHLFMESEGYIRLKADASISSKELYEIIVVVTLDGLSVGFGALTFREFEIVGNQTLQSLKRPEENALQMCIRDRLWKIINIQNRRIFFY